MFTLLLKYFDFIICHFKSGMQLADQNYYKLWQSAVHSKVNLMATILYLLWEQDTADCAFWQLEFY